MIQKQRAQRSSPLLFFCGNSTTFAERLLRAAGSAALSAFGFLGPGGSDLVPLHCSTFENLGSQYKGEHTRLEKADVLFVFQVLSRSNDLLLQVQ